jgi:hypothetical protein
MNSTDNLGNLGGQPTEQTTTTVKVLRRQTRVNDLLSDRDGVLPVWVRSPKIGAEHYTGLGRSKLYELAAKGKIKSRSIREPGQIKGTRLFNLRSILDFIESCGNENEIGSVRGEMDGSK